MGGACLHVCVDAHACGAQGWYWNHPQLFFQILPWGKICPSNLQTWSLLTASWIWGSQSPPSKAGITSRTSYLSGIYVDSGTMNSSFHTAMENSNHESFPQPTFYMLDLYTQGHRISFLSIYIFFCIYLSWRELSQFLSKGQRTTFGHCLSPWILWYWTIHNWTIQLLNYPRFWTQVIRLSCRPLQWLSHHPNPNFSTSVSTFVSTPHAKSQDFWSVFSLMKWHKDSWETHFAVGPYGANRHQYCCHRQDFWNVYRCFACMYIPLA